MLEVNILPSERKRRKSCAIATSYSFWHSGRRLTPTSGIRAEVGGSNPAANISVGPSPCGA